MPSQTRFVGQSQNISRDVGDTVWSNPTNAGGDNDTEASCAPLLNGGKSQWLRGNNCGFTVPAGSTITGILAEVERRASFTNRFYDNGIFLVALGVGSPSLSTGATWSDTLGYVAFGGDGNTWGMSWTVDQINAADFGVQLGGVRSGNSVTAFVRRLRLTVFYTEPDTTPPIPDIISVTATKISRVPGKDALEINWQADEAFQAYQIRVVPDASSPVTAGTLVEEDQNPLSGGDASTVYTATVTDDEVVNADPAEGSKIIKIFTQDLAGNWSV